MKTAQCVTFLKTAARETIKIVVLFQRSPIRDRHMTFCPVCISVFFVIFRACIAISVCFILSAVAITSRAVYALVADNKLGRVGKLPRQVLKRFFFLFSLLNIKTSNSICDLYFAGVVFFVVRSLLNNHVRFRQPFMSCINDDDSGKENVTWK